MNITRYRLEKRFFLAAEFVKTNKEWMLAHGVIVDGPFGAKHDLVHAWCESGDLVYEPVSGLRFKKAEFYQKYCAMYHRHAPTLRHLANQALSVIRYSPLEVRLLSWLKGSEKPWDASLCAINVSIVSREYFRIKQEKRP